MAHIYHPVAVKPIPAAAVVRTVNGQKVATWTNRKHRKVTAPLTADGLKCRVASPVWWVEYTAASGERARAKGFKDRAATLQLAASLERTADDICGGRETARKDSPAHLIDHLPGFEAALIQKGNGEQHVGYVLDNVRAVVTHLDLKTPASVDCDRVTAWLTAECKRVDRSPETFNRHVKHLRQFGRWLVRSRKSKLNPFEWLNTVNASQHRTQFRRRLTDDELLRLIETARASEVTVHAMSGPDRARLYMLASYTGLRMGALSKLTPNSFAWDGDKSSKKVVPIAVTVTARMAKNKKPHTVALNPDIAAAIASWLRGCEPGVPIFAAGRWAKRGSELVAHDLDAARVKWIGEAKSKKEKAAREKSDTLKRVNSDDEVFDFHTFRLQFISGLALAGVPLSAAQKLADHSTPALTSNIYTKWDATEMLEQVGKLPKLKLS